MRKISLNLDALAVERFETSPATRGRGTVVGHAAATAHTCVATCAYTCGAPPPDTTTARVATMVGCPACV
ncbi:MAG TPA: hypothetical protein VFE05_17980 [Longimicrobiaceae bacterium]|jgi:hypothetical protein|nr:hypothetical protein [Longimicrobiaceae bacterium]